MKSVLLGKSSLSVSRLAYGCWRIAGTWNAAEVTTDARAAGMAVVRAAFEAGFTFFDHADIYCDGVAEEIFGQVLKDSPGQREHVVLASKCGIRKPETESGAGYRYDFSADYIVRSCEQSLRRLQVETLDLYQLHRPDYLMDPAEVAAAFDQLHRSGKVRFFGVSNFNCSQFDLLQRACAQPLVVNQVEISLAQLQPFEDGTLDQCLAEQVTPMAWSPLAGGLLGDGARRLLTAQEAYRPQRFLAVLDQLAQKRGISRTELALAWLMRHPAGIIPIIGSTNPANIQRAARADSTVLNREEWYQLFTAAREQPLP